MNGDSVDASQDAWQDAKIEDYDYDLPKELIAQDPMPNRSDSRLMVVDRQSGTIEHSHFRDIGDYLKRNDCLVFNDSKVVPAKLIGRREKTGGRWHGLFLDANEMGIWKILCKTRGKIQPGEKVIVENRSGIPTFELEMMARLNDGEWAVKPNGEKSWKELLDETGQIPLPHYIRGGAMKDSDVKNYQTVYAKKPGAVAAPTAGLHFTKELLVALNQAEIGIANVTLHVGVGTFRPVKVSRLDDHEMHCEWGELEQVSVDKIKSCKANDGRVISVGTTTVRVLETAAKSMRLEPWNGETDLFIRPPYQFRLVDSLITNFHLPKSTLLVLVRCFGGDELITEAYRKAIEEKYRFFSYGDAMLIV